MAKNNKVNLEFELLKRDVRLMFFEAGSIPPRNIVWTEKSESGVVGLAFRRPAKVSEKLLTFVTVIFKNHIIYDFRLIRGRNGKVTLMPPVKVVGDKYIPTAIISKSLMASLQKDVVEAFQEFIKSFKDRQ